MVYPRVDNSCHQLRGTQTTDNDLISITRRDGIEYKSAISKSQCKMITSTEPFHAETTARVFSKNKEKEMKIAQPYSRTPFGKLPA
jgi:hypothetical protein